MRYRNSASGREERGAARVGNLNWFAAIFHREQMRAFRSMTRRSDDRDRVVADLNLLAVRRDDVVSTCPEVAVDGFLDGLQSGPPITNCAGNTVLQFGAADVIGRVQMITYLTSWRPGRFFSPPRISSRSCRYKYPDDIPIVQSAPTSCGFFEPIK